MKKSFLPLALTLQAACTTPPPPTPVVTVDIPAPPTDTPTYQEIPHNQDSAPFESSKKLTSEMMADIRWKCQEATHYLACSHDELALFFQIQKKYPITVGLCKEDNDWNQICTDRLFQESHLSSDQTVELYTAIRAQCHFMFQKCVTDELSRGGEW
ncbi:MAG: hypothetical protein ACRCZE_02610 [Candidatus Altimarinota bacterium]